MERREFVKNLSFISVGFSAVPFFHINHSCSGAIYFKPEELFSLRGNKNEKEESPVLVTNKSGDNWLFALRRLPYPENREVIGCYKQNINSWVEIDPVSLKEGQYENPSAVCLPGGEPVVAWNSIMEEGDWSVEVVSYINGKPTIPIVIKSSRGKDIHPKLIAGRKGNIWLVWENYYKANFSIYLSEFRNGKWSEPKQMTLDDKVCFDPTLAEGTEGKLYLAYTTMGGFHQNIEMQIYDSDTLECEKTIPVAIGGGLKNRVNLNNKPALAFDSNNRLWVSWENNKNTHRLDDGDNFTGDRCCCMVCYADGKLWETGSGKWLFKGKNDHLPTFIKDEHDNLYIFTRCGGDFDKNPFWKFRVSRLEPNGWTEPEIILQTNQKGQTAVPSAVFSNNKLWLTWRFERFTDSQKGISIRENYLNISQFEVPGIKISKSEIVLKETKVNGFLPSENEMAVGGRLRIGRREKVIDGQKYILIMGNLHEHSEGSYCWPAGSDGTLHDDFRYGLFSEGYDFMSITDHTRTLDEADWRKSIRIADFYNDGVNYVALPAAEWTLSPPRNFRSIPPGVGHRNIVFASGKEANKFIRNNKEIFSEFSPETDSAPKLWKMIHNRKIDCVAIPHHVADEIHPVSWEERDAELEPVVELFQCRGNTEYPGCPRENNLDRHRTTHHREAFVDYALRDKKYNLGFIGSGEHNSMGVGLAVLWVKEVSREGILEALRERHCYATTGEKIYVEFSINKKPMGGKIKLDSPPEINITAKGVKPLAKVELLRNSKIFRTWEIANGKKIFSKDFIDINFKQGKKVLYYYVRITQVDGNIAWSSPVYIEV